MAAPTEAPAARALRARVAAGQQSADARAARTGTRAPDPAVGAAGRDAQWATLCALVTAHTDLTDPARIAVAAGALRTAFLRARREHWTTLPLTAWAPGFLAGEG